jgi:hypothetical protein
MDLYPNADLSSPLVQRYLEDGYVILPNVLSPEIMTQVSLLRLGVTVKVSEHVTWLMEQNPDVPPELLEHYLMRDDPFWIKLVGIHCCLCLLTTRGDKREVIGNCQSVFGT